MTTTLSRRTFLAATSAAGGLLVTGLRSTHSLAQSDKHGGLLRVSVTFGLSTINPIMHISGAEWMATKWMYNNLTRLGGKRIFFQKVPPEGLCGQVAHRIPTANLVYPGMTANACIRRPLPLTYLVAKT